VAACSAEARGDGGGERVKPYYSDSSVVIYHGESLEVIPQLSGIAGVVTDPPYSSGGAFRGDRTMATLTKYVSSDAADQLRLSNFSGDNRDQRSFLAWSALWLTAALHASTPGAAVMVFIDWRQLPTMTDAIQAGGWVWRGIGTWWKPGIRMQRGRLSGSAEYVVYGTAGPTLDHDGAPQNVIACAPEDEKLHIAQKPEPVVAWASAVVPPGGPILDPFMGSGTTLRVAKDAGRQAIGIDIDEESCEIAARRMAQRTLFEAEGFAPAVTP